MLKNKYFNNMMIILSLVSFSIIGCSNDDDTTVAPQSNEVFTSETSEKLDSSIISLPSSLVAQQDGKNTRATRSEGGIESIYSGIANYVGMIDMFGGFVKELMVDITDSQLLQYATLGQEITIPEDPTDPDSPKKVKVEKPDAAGSGEDYVWKVSLYFDAGATSPDLICRFTLGDSAGAKGRILWSMTEEEEELTEAGITGINITRTIDITFDGTSATKTLEVKLIQDLNEIFEYATANWSTLSDDEKDALDIGQPSKVFCNATYDGTEFTIYGTSYHAGWATEATLNEEDTMWGNDRTMYMFKAKAIEGATEGAKLYLALPSQTTSNTENVWTEDSLGEIFTNMMLNVVNSMIAALHIGTAEEQGQADAIVTFLTGTAPATESDYTITKAELIAFVESEQSGDAEAFQNQYKSIAYMINPAFYDATNGFLGTYDENSDIFYNFINNAMTAGTAPASFTTLNALDLSSIDPYVPTEVVAATITVE